MQKMDKDIMREINGGRWQCKNCNKKTLTIAEMHFHLMAHGYVSKGLLNKIGSNDVSMSVGWAYKWVW